MILEEIKLETETSKTKAILDNLGKEVFLYDLHNKWIHGFLLKEDYTNQIYKIAIAPLRELMKILHYHDLQRLFLLKEIE